MTGISSDLYIWAQGAGLCAFLLKIFAGYLLSSRHIMLYLGLSNVLWVGHYILIGTALAAIISLLAGLRLLVSVHINARYLPHVVCCAIALFLAASVHSYHGPASLLPVIGSVVLTLSLLRRDDVVIVRSGAAFMCVMWTLHGCATGSVIEIVANALALIVIIKAFIKYDMPALKIARSHAIAEI